MKPPYETRLIGATEVCAELQCSIPIARRAIREMQAELTANNYIVIGCKVPWTYLYDRYNLWRPGERETYFSGEKTRKPRKGAAK